MSAPLLEIAGLTVCHVDRHHRSRIVRAVDDVDLSVSPGECLCLVGESGCGKSSLARAVMGLGTTSGEIRFNGECLPLDVRHRSAAMRRGLQMVFQDPVASLNPRMRIGEIVAEPLRALMPELTTAETRRRCEAVLARVGLGGDFARRFPHELSGGQCQRVAIARALVAEPKVLVCDEAISALDVSVQGQIVGLLEDLRREFGMALFFITHNLGVVRQIADRVLVMYLGRIVEAAPVEALFKTPRHPYTQLLLASVPVPDPVLERRRERHIDTRDSALPSESIAGCRFRMRCAKATIRCADQDPRLEPIAAGHVACHHAGDPSGIVSERSPG